MVAENGTLTYTLTLQNRGNTAADAGDELVITDTFDPILKNLTVRFNGTLWTQGVHYTYDETTGTFATVVGALTARRHVYPGCRHRCVHGGSRHLRADHHRVAVREQSNRDGTPSRFSYSDGN